MARFLLRRELISTILNQGNTILHYRNYLYILNLLFFGRCSPNGELYWRDPEPVGGWRGQGGSWPQDVVPVNEQNCNSRTSGSRFVHCPRSFHLFFPSIHVCPLAWPILQTLLRPHENVELHTFMCHIFMYISSWNSASTVRFFLYIHREGQRSNGCAEDKYPHSPKEVRYIGERDSDWGVSSYYVWMQWMPGSARLMTLHQYGLKKVVCLG